jgi:hypothetical protein
MRKGQFANGQTANPIFLFFTGLQKAQASSTMFPDCFEKFMHETINSSHHGQVCGEVM